MRDEELVRKMMEHPEAVARMLADVSNRFEAIKLLADPEVVVGGLLAWPTTMSASQQERLRAVTHEAVEKFVEIFNEDDEDDDALRVFSVSNRVYGSKN